MVITNISQIEEIKKVLLLFLDIPYSLNNNSLGLPIFLQHPIIKDRFCILLNEDKKETLIDITTDDNLAKIKKQYQEQINGIKTVEEVYSIIGKDYLGMFFKYANTYLNKKDYNHTLKHIFFSMEYPYNDINVSKEEYLDFFKRANRDLLMDTKELQIYDGLPCNVEIYCVDKVDGLFWTLVLDKANRFKNKGRIYQATIDKKYILAYFSEKKEFEVIVDYTKINNVSEIN